MNAKEICDFYRQYARFCEAQEEEYGECDCPLKGKGGCDFFDKIENNDIERVKFIVNTVEKWAAEHPEEQLEQVGDGIYFDPMHRIVADEVVRVYQMEVTVVGENNQEMDEKHLRICGRTLANNISNAFSTIEDVECVGAQQFITKSHEEKL